MLKSISGRLSFALVLALSPCAAKSAMAATRTVCANIGFLDTRTDCPTTSTTGARGGCNPGGVSPAIGQTLELWDKDPGGGTNDEYIATYRLMGPGTACFTVEWENASYSNGEVNPDFYLRWTNVVAPNTFDGNANSKQIHLRNASNAAYPAVYWGGSDNDDSQNALNCTAGTTCWMVPGATLIPVGNSALAHAQAIMAQDAAGHTLNVYWNKIDPNNYMLHAPEDSGCSFGCTWSQTEFGLPTGLITDGDRASHEFGHIVQRQLGGGRFNSNCAGSWSATSNEFDSCATQEAWASYVAAVSWYDPGVTAVAPMYSGNNIETAAPHNATCDNNRGIPLQVMKSFWDLDDGNNEAGVAPASGFADVSSLQTSWIADGWGLFPSGTANRQREENDDHGANVRDYNFHRGANTTTLLSHNCIGAQTND